MEGLAELACRPGRWVLPSVLVRGRHILVEGGQEGCIRTTFVASSTTSLKTTLKPATMKSSLIMNSL